MSLEVSFLDVKSWYSKNYKMYVLETEVSLAPFGLCVHTIADKKVV